MMYLSMIVLHNPENFVNKVKLPSVGVLLPVEAGKLKKGRELVNNFRPLS